MEKYNLFKDETCEGNYERIMEGIRKKGFFAELKDKMEFTLYLNGYIGRILRLCNISLEHIDRNGRFDLLTNKIGRVVFQTYLTIGNRTGTSLALTYLECYDECCFILKNSKEKFNEEYLKHFYELTPELGWESRAKYAFKNNMLKIENGIEQIINLKKECIWNILIDKRYNSFKTSLLERKRVIKKILLMMKRELGKN